MATGIIDQALSYIADHQLETEIVKSLATSVKGNSSAWISVTPPSGTICICGYALAGTNNTSCSVYACRISDTGLSAQIAVRNWGSAAANITADVHFLKYSGGGSA